MAEDRQVRLKNRRFAASRLAGFKVVDNRERMMVRLRNPIDAFEVIGADNVSAATQEIQRALEPDWGPGWSDVGD